MALVACPECSRQISDQAAACPQCGFGMSVPSPVGAAYKDGSSYVTNQGTSKSLKLQSALSLALLVSSILGAIGSSDPEGGAIWGFGIIVGFVWLVIVRVVKRWRHA